MGEMKIRSRGKNAETGMQQGPKQSTVIFSAAVQLLHFGPSL